MNLAALDASHLVLSLIGLGLGFLLAQQVQYLRARSVKAGQPLDEAQHLILESLLKQLLNQLGQHKKPAG